MCHDVESDLHYTTVCLQRIMAFLLLAITTCAEMSPMISHFIHKDSTSIKWDIEDPPWAAYKED